MAFLSARSLQHLVELGDESHHSETRCLSKKAVEILMYKAVHEFRPFCSFLR